MTGRQPRRGDGELRCAAKFNLRRPSGRRARTDIDNRFRERGRRRVTTTCRDVIREPPTARPTTTAAAAQEEAGVTAVGSQAMCCCGVKIRARFKLASSLS